HKAKRLVLRRQDLTAAVHAGLQVDVVRTAQLTRVLVFDIGGGRKTVVRATETALHRRGLALRNRHLRYSRFLNSGSPKTFRRITDRVCREFGRVYNREMHGWEGGIRPSGP